MCYMQGRHRRSCDSVKNVINKGVSNYFVTGDLDSTHFVTTVLHAKGYSVMT